MTRAFSLGSVFLALAATAAAAPVASRDSAPKSGVASWYGEAHRGKLMANGDKFNPDVFTAASWFYPLGTRLRVTANREGKKPTSIVVTVTDRGPAMRFVKEGRIIDLGQAAFRRLADPELGLVPVTIQPVDSPRRDVGG